MIIIFKVTLSLVITGVWAETLITLKTDSTEILNKTIATRRILIGHEVKDTRPYMVYLRPATTSDPQLFATNWLCGGVIIHERYILTSAACIENAKHFYVVSGTHRWVPPTQKNDECVNNGAKRAVWKCVPKSYVYDGDEFDNIRWMANDIAVVKVEDDFNFNRRVRGCDFIPKKIGFNNNSNDMEKSGTVASIAGWGSVEKFSDVIGRSGLNSPLLLESDVVLISKKNCKKRWPERYHHLIDDHMICGKDSLDSDAMSALCERDTSCKELVYSDEDEDSPHRRFIVDPEDLHVHTADHFNTRRSKVTSGGFCENDHGGPLVVGQGMGATVVGIISACQTKELTNKCYGPFLYTSIWNNRNLINCAINKDVGATCKRLLRTSKSQISETVFDWTKHPDGPAKSEDINKRAFNFSVANNKFSVNRSIVFRVYESD